MLNQILVLSRPLAILDLETTGLSEENDRIVQMCITMHYPDKEPVKWKSLVNPGMPIPPGATEKHKITDDMIGDAPTFAKLAPSFGKQMLNVDIGGYNVQFDIKFLRAEMKRAGVDWPWDNYIVDPFLIYKQKRGHTLENCYREYGGENGEPLPSDTVLEGAHDAGVDVWATEIALRGQLLRYKNLPRTVKELSAFCFPRDENWVDSTGKFVWVGNDAAFNFGKFRGKLISDPACRGYLKWMSGGDFPADARAIAEAAVGGAFVNKEDYK